MLSKFSLWKYLICRWIRSQKECRKLRRQRDVLHGIIEDVYDNDFNLEDSLSKEQMNVFREVYKEIDGRS